MKICVITATYPLKDFGGIFIKEQCEQLAINGHEVVVLYCSGLQNSVFDNRVHSFEEKGVRVFYNCFPHFATTYAPHFWCKVMMNQLRIMYRQLVSEKWKPDVFYAHFSFPAGRIATQLGQEENIPVVIAEHWSGLINGKAKRGVLSIIEQTLEKATSVICVSPALRDAVVKLANEQVVINVIPNMLSPGFIYRPRKIKDSFVFFSLGTLNNKKQFDLLIQSFLEAFRPEENVHLRIGGSGPDEEKLRQLIVESKRDHQISLLGRLDRNETLNEFAICDSFILLSPKETFGIVYREAMAVGRPIISLDNGGINYKWNDECGKIIRCSSDDVIEQTATAMRQMVSSINCYNMKAISDYTLGEFSADRVSKQIEKVLQEAAYNSGKDTERK